MEVYRRITERVRGAMWAHHRKLMSERQFNRILGFVYNNKYEYQIRLDRMTVVGREWDGRVEVAATPAGHIKRVRVNPAFQDLPVPQQKALLLAAYSDACKQGYAIMQQAEMKVYGQFLQDLKPVVMGIRDNPEFYTLPHDARETVGGVLRGASGAAAPVRTIPFAKDINPATVHKARTDTIDANLRNPAWHRLSAAKVYKATQIPELRPRGAPGPKKAAPAQPINVAYGAHDEARLSRKNWMAYLDNKHVAESLWTRAKIADKTKADGARRRYGQAWHAPVEGMQQQPQQ